MGNKRREGVEEEKKKVEEGGQVKNEAVVFAGDRRQLRNVNNNKTNNKKKENTAKFQFQSNTPENSTLSHGLCMFYSTEESMSRCSMYVLCTRACQNGCFI